MILTRVETGRTLRPEPDAAKSSDPTRVLSRISQFKSAPVGTVGRDFMRRRVTIKGGVGPLKRSRHLR